MLEAIEEVRAEDIIVKILPCPWFNEEKKKSRWKTNETYNKFEFLKLHMVRGESWWLELGGKSRNKEIFSVVWGTVINVLTMQ